MLHHIIWVMVVFCCVGHVVLFKLRRNFQCRDTLTCAIGDKPKVQYLYADITGLILNHENI